MVYVFGFFAIGLAVAAYCSRERGTRIFFVCCCLLNLAGVAELLVTHDPYAFGLKPNNGVYEPNYRR